MNEDIFAELFRRNAEQAEALEAMQAAGDDAAVTFSPSFEERMELLCARMRTGRYRRVYGKARALLIAAIVAVLLMTVTAGAAWYRATVQYDPDWGENVYHVEGGRDEGLPADPRPAYIPERFTRIVSETRADDNYQLVMEAANGDILAVTVRPAATDHLFDAERGENDWIEVDGTTYFRFRVRASDDAVSDVRMLTFADDRYVVTAAIWGETGDAQDAVLAAVIRSVPVR